MISSSEDCAFKEIPSSKYDKWIQKMKEHLPTSATIYNSLLLHRRGHIDAFSFFYLKSDLSSPVTLMLDKDCSNIASIFCPLLKEELTGLETALLSTNLINWNEVIFFHVFDWCQDILLRVGKAKNKKIKCKPQNFLVLDLNLEEQLQVPPGITLKSVRGESASQVFEAWEYREVSSEDFRKKIFLDMVKKTPNVALFLSEAEESTTLQLGTGLPEAGDTEKSLAWVSTVMMGSIGLFGTSDEVSGEDAVSYKRLVVAACAALMRAQDLFVHAYSDGGEHYCSVRKDMKGWRRRDLTFMIWFQ